MDYKERLEKISQRNLKKKHTKGQHWPIEKKIEVVSQYLVLGNASLVSAVTGVGPVIIRQWKMQPWWKELEKEIRTTQNIEMDTKLSKIVDKSLDAVLDRVENGDFIYDQKTGEIRRKPASLRDIHRVSMDSLDKRELLRENPEKKQDTQIAVVEQLKILATEFAKWSNSAKHPVIELNSEDVTDVEPIEILQPGDDAGEVWDDDELGVGEELVDDGEAGDSGEQELSGAASDEREGEISTLGESEAKT